MTGKAMRATIAAACAMAMWVPGTAAAATISGTVSAEDTHAGLGGVEVCPTPQPYTFEADCTETDSSGHYSLTDLPAAQYVLRFSAWQANLRYVDEFYDNAAWYEDADPVTLGSFDASEQIDVELAAGGSIAGTVIDEETKEPIEGLAACAWTAAGPYQRCDISDAAGSYEINGLPSDEYVVEFEGWNRVNYIRELYDNADSLAAATDVPVVTPTTTSGIDAELAPGAEILGHVSETSTGAPVENAMVCAPLASAPPEDTNTNCEWTDASGDYAIRGLPAGTYAVAFDVDFGAGPFGGMTVGQWWKEASTRSEATLLELSNPQTVTGIDGKASRPYWTPPTTETETPPTSPPPVVLALPRPKPPVKCHKGFHRKLVKGKKRCVRKHRHHRRHRYEHQRSHHR